MALNILDIGQWVEENKSSFKPPVCNKLMHGAGQLKVMFIGGPNQRKDYHIEEGEEFFLQLKGDMCLKIVEKNKHKDVVIKEGECYLHPSRIPHSPQRFENTVGLVIERERSKEEWDGLRYYIDGTVDPLWEEWFYCYDLGVQLGPVIKRYFASEEHEKGKPPEGKTFAPPPVNLDVTREVDTPLNLDQWIRENGKKGPVQLYNQGEFKITVWGEGEVTETNPGETFLWQREGEAELTCDRGSGRMTAGSCFLLTAGEKYTVKRGENSIAITVTTDPLANKSKSS